jgi:hypothetical protein
MTFTPPQSSRAYYSVRTGKNPRSRFDLDTCVRLFKSLHSGLEERGYFQEHFGYDCVDAGFVCGKLGSDIEAAILVRVRKSDLWPVHRKADAYSEDDLFDVIELLYDHVSKPINGEHHTWNKCGWHYTEFEDSKGARTEFRCAINDLLRDYAEGFELSPEGEVLALAQEPGLQQLLDAPVPTHDPKNVQKRVDGAIRKFRRHRATPENLRDAVRDLADVLEFMRPEAERLLAKKDEAMLFQIANQFNIRHHNEKQHGDYDNAIWHSWMFYIYLASIQAVLRSLEREKGAPKAPWDS